MNWFFRLFGIQTLESILVKFETAISDLAAHENAKLKEEAKALELAAKHSAIATEAKAVAAKAASIRANIESLLNK